MTTDITFPDSEPDYLFDRACLAFRARVDGEPVVCVITAELLFSHFKAHDFAEETLRESFRRHRAEIEAIARGHIENGWIDEERRVFLTTRYTRLTVDFDESLRESPVNLKVAKIVHRALLGIIGPNAKSVEVRLAMTADRPGEPAIELRITDSDLKYSVERVFDRLDAADPSSLSVHLGRLWGNVLRERSRKLTLQSG